MLHMSSAMLTARQNPAFSSSTIKAITPIFWDKAMQVRVPPVTTFDVGNLHLCADYLADSYGTYGHPLNAIRALHLPTHPALSPHDPGSMYLSG